MKFVLDSNILISALNLNDVFNEEAAAVAEVSNRNNFEVIAPVLHLWELEAYLRHTVKSTTHVPNSDLKLKVTTYDVTSGLFTRTYKSDLACVKGADRVFVSLAMDHDCPLVTNDEQIHKYADIFGIKTIYASDFVAEKF